MGFTQLIFDNQQLNRLFPYYLLVDEDLTIDKYGPKLAEFIAFFPGQKFTELFKIAGETGNVDLFSHCSNSITIEILVRTELVLSGNLEYLSQTRQFLFVGELKANPHEKISGGNVSFNKFDYFFFENVLNEVPADIAVLDTNHIYRFLNKGAVKDDSLRNWMIGKTDEAYCLLTQKPAASAIERRGQFNEVLKNKKLKSWEEKIIGPDGFIAYKLRNMHPIINEQNEVEFIIVYGIDITDRKQIEQELRFNEQRYRDLYNFSPALIYTHDTTGMMLSVNPAICGVLGYKGEDIIGKSIKALLPMNDREKVESEYLQTINSKGASKGVFRIVHKNGGIKYLLFQNYKVEDKENAPYIIGFSQDITDRIKIEKELLLAKRATENMADVKETFLSNMGHELRTPINGILGITSLLAKTKLDEQQKHYADIISDSVNDLLIIINDILDMQKINSGEIDFENEPFRVTGKVSSTVQSYQYKAEQKGIELIYNNHLSEDLVVIGDQHRLMQILANLLSNAIKFTAAGSVTVSLALTHQSEKEVVIEFSVRDTGIGISTKRVSTIFDPFIKATSKNNKFEGTGIGLAICKGLIEMQGGSIKLSSILNKGTTFTFNVPYKLGVLNDVYDKNDGHEVLGRIEKRVLVTDDIELNRFLAKTMLESWGCEVDIAADGLEAIKKVEEHDYDLLLMDIKMPVMDGIEATRYIRKLPDANKANVPIIAFTANALKGDSKTYKDAGMNDYIIKPCSEEKLHDKISEVLNVAAGNAIVEVEDASEVNYSYNVNQLGTAILAERQKLYDIGMLEAIGAASPGFLEKMIIMFVDLISKDIDSLKRAIDQNDLKEAASLAHKMKSTFGNMGVTSLQPYIKQLEAGTGDPHELVGILNEGLIMVISQIRDDYPQLF